jgi:tRNA nucleotidyltransferase (CCA-adding enzyme)
MVLHHNHDVSREPRDQDGKWTKEKYNTALREWAYDTKVVDANGLPKRVYHGTSVKQNFDTFKLGKRGQWGHGIYFTDDPQYADFFANENGGPSPRIIPAYLRLRNPYIWREGSRNFAELAGMMEDRSGASKGIPVYLKKMGYDGIIIPGAEGLPSQYVAFNAGQVKSAYGNSGAFDVFDKRMNKGLLLIEKAHDVAGEARDARGRWSTVADAIQISPDVQAVLDSLRAAGGVPLIVGGSVRDAVLGHTVKDVDIESYHLTPEKLVQALSKHGKVDLVGQSFGVYKIRLKNGEDLDVSLPRTENKIGASHQDYEVTADPFMSPKEAASRRDFTINSLAYDPFERKVHDFHGGMTDLDNKTLRHIGPAFAEDALRVLRAMQFAGRFGLKLDPTTAKLAASLRQEYPHIAKERVWTEWEKLVTKAKQPSKGIDVLEQSGWIDFYPELKAMTDVPQEKDWHPEGKVLVHTKYVADEAARIADRDGLKGDQRAVLVLAAICHDMGKAIPGITVVTEKYGQQRITSAGHAEAGVVPAAKFLDRIGCPIDIKKAVLILVREHMAHTGVSANHRTVSRLAKRLDPLTVREWERIVEADHSGRPPLPRARPAKGWIDVAESLGADKGKVKPLIGGDMLIARGMKPGPIFKQILDAAYEAQMDNTVTPENKDAWLDKFLQEHRFSKSDGRALLLLKAKHDVSQEPRDSKGKWTAEDSTSNERTVTEAIENPRIGDVIERGKHGKITVVGFGKDDKRKRGVKILLAMPHTPPMVMTVSLASWQESCGVGPMAEFSPPGIVIPTQEDLPSFLPSSKQKVNSLSRSLSPQGTPVSAAFTFPKSGSAESLKVALAAIDRVHGDGVLPVIPAVLSSAKVRDGGYYARGSQAVKVSVSRNADNLPSTFVHEVGHFIDQQGIGKGVFASEGFDNAFPEMLPWHEAVTKSKAFKTLLALSKKAGVDINGPDGKAQWYSLNTK